MWCICDRANGEALGIIELLPLPIDQDDTDWEQLIEDQLPDGEIEIGYFLRRPAWGKGFATEAAERLLRFAFEDTSLKEVVAVIDPENKSGYLHEKMDEILFGTNFGIATDLKFGPDGAIYVVSIMDGTIYRITLQ